MKYLIIAICFLLTACGNQQSNKLHDMSDRMIERSSHVSNPADEHDKKVYDPSECVGTVVAGVCHGEILPNKAVHPVCHGEMLNGQCTGPLF